MYVANASVNWRGRKENRPGHKKTYLQCFVEKNSRKRNSPWEVGRDFKYSSGWCQIVLKVVRCVEYSGMTKNK